MTAYREEPEENQQWRKKIRALVLNRHPGIRGKSLAEKCAEYWKGFDGKWELSNEFEDIGVSIWERPSEIKSGAFFNVGTAASITGCVRAHLFASLRACGGVVYCDTDSIICRTTGGLPLGGDLGAWKLEAISAPDSVWIAGKKLYALKLAPEFWTAKKDGKTIKWADASKADRKGLEWKKWKTASKGVRLSPEEIVTVAEGTEVKSTLDAPTFSLFTSRRIGGSEKDFITRTVRRDDQRKRRIAA
jgi:hypothetical protein